MEKAHPITIENLNAENIQGIFRCALYARCSEIEYFPHVLNEYFLNASKARYNLNECEAIAQLV